MPILIKRADGGVSIMYPAKDAVIEDEIAKWEKGGLKAMAYCEVGLADIPKDRTTRGEWDFSAIASASRGVVKRIDTATATDSRALP